MVRLVLIRGRRADIPVFGWAVTNYRGNLSSCGKLDSNFFMFNAPRAVHNQASRSVWVLGQAFNIVVRPDTPQFVVLDQGGVDMSNLCRARPHIPEPQKMALVRYWKWCSGRCEPDRRSAAFSTCNSQFRRVQLWTKTGMYEGF